MAIPMEAPEPHAETHPEMEAEPEAGSLRARPSKSRSPCKSWKRSPSKRPSWC